MSSQRTYIWRVVLQPCLRRSVRSGLTVLPLHTGTEHRYWSSAETGEGKEPSFIYIRPDAYREIGYVL